MEPTDNSASSALEMKTFLQLKGLMGDKFSIVLQGYLRSAEEFVAQTNTAINENNAQLLMESAHPLKSSSAQIGATKVRDIAEKLETNAYQALSDNTDVIDNKTLLDLLNSEFSGLKTALEEHLSKAS